MWINFTWQRSKELLTLECGVTLPGVCEDGAPTARGETRERSPSGRTNPWSSVSSCGGNPDGPERRRRRPTVQTVHLLWKFPHMVTNGKLEAVVCPLHLIVTPPIDDHTLHLMHYEAINYVCGSEVGINWICSRYRTPMCSLRVLVTESIGAMEHNYSHWLYLDNSTGWLDLPRFLFCKVEAASAAKRDATPLQLLSWLSFRLEPAVEKFIEDTMHHLSKVEEVKHSDLLALGTHLETDTLFVSTEELRDHLIELISVRNLKHRPEALFAFFRQFLQGYVTSWTWCYHSSPQCVPSGLMLLGRYGLVTTLGRSYVNGSPFEPRVTIGYFFSSRSNTLRANHLGHIAASLVLGSTHGVSCEHR